MQITFRVDASLQMGTGHVMRCLTLAQALRERGADCRFVCREHPGHLIQSIRGLGFEVMALPLGSESSNLDGDNADQLTHAPWLGATWRSDAAQTIQALGEDRPDWVVEDHYALDARWESELRPYCGKIMVIDDLADRDHNCDLLLDQNFYFNKDLRYQGLIPTPSKTLLGPAYVLLRPEFAEARQVLRVRNGVVKNILVFFGGSDLKDQTRIVLTALERINRLDISVDVIVGHTNPNRHSIQALCDHLPDVTYHCNVSNMAELIVNADLGIGAGGSAMWERCYLGLPTITVVSAENQVRTTEDVAQLGAIEYLGWADSLKATDYERTISSLINNSQKLKRISDTALAVVQQKTTNSVVDEILNFH